MASGNQFYTQMRVVSNQVYMTRSMAREEKMRIGNRDLYEGNQRVLDTPKGFVKVMISNINAFKS